MDTNIIIKQENQKRILETIDKVQSRARERKITYYDQITNIIESVEKRVGTIPKAAWKGTRIIYDFRQHFPNCYKGRPESTHIVLEHTGKDWKLIRCDRDWCPNVNSLYCYGLRLSDKAKEEILKRYE